MIKAQVFLKSSNSLLLIAALAVFSIRNIKKHHFLMAAFSFFDSILLLMSSWKANSDWWLAVANDTITSWVSHKVKRCFLPQREVLETHHHLLMQAPHWRWCSKDYWWHCWCGEGVEDLAPKNRYILNVLLLQ